MRVDRRADKMRLEGPKTAPADAPTAHQRSDDNTSMPCSRSDSPASSMRSMTPEHLRLDETLRGEKNWKRWGPYLSERQWGTVREDYSLHGEAWDYLTHDAARSRAYRWGEDGIAGVSDDQQRLCLSITLWNGRDPILKERLFGLTNGE